MNIFVFEFLSGGGLYLDPLVSDNEIANARQLAIRSLAQEGIAMLGAVTDDFLAIENASVLTLCDSRIWKPESNDLFRYIEVDSTESCRTQLEQLGQECDHALVIAPEINHHLSRIVSDLETSGVSLLSPGKVFTSLAADKLKCFQQWNAKGCPTIETLDAAAAADARVWFKQGKRVVLKPRFGVGSCEMSLHSSQETLRSGLDLAQQTNLPMVIQPFEAGLPVSVAAIGDGRSWRFLPGCQQVCSDNFAYQGGRFPLAADLNQRAQEIAKSALNAFPPTNGYVGIDILLGQQDNDSQDKVVEVNPRLTTSYIGLRSACNKNLAAAMLAAKSGRTPKLTFNRNHLSFDTAGMITNHES